MIDSKEQYRFVSAEALKRITVKGLPYPKRDQKLVTIGEDEAFLKEAQEERRVIKGAAGEVSDKVILKVNRSLDRSATSVAAWIDPDKLDSIEIPKDGKVGKVCVATTYEKGVIIEEHYKRNEQARKHYTDTKEKNEKRIGDLRDALYKSIYGERDEKGEIVVEGEKDRADKKKKDAKNAYIEKSNELSEAHYNRLEELREEHRNKQDEISRERTQAESQIAEQMASETDHNERAKLNVKLEKVKVEYATRSKEEDMRYSKYTYDESKAYDAKRRKLNKAYDDEVSKINKELEEFIEKSTRKVDESVERLNDEIDDAHVYMMKNGGGGVSVEPFEAMKKYDASVEDAYISKSCADKFDERPIVPAMSSTRLNRVFADLERMKICTYGGLARRPCWIDFGNSVDVISGKTMQNKSFYEEWKRSSSSQGVSCYYLSVKDKSGSAIIYGTEYGIYIGNRNNADVIKKIYADILICRREEKGEVVGKVPYTRVKWKANTKCEEDTIFETDEHNYIYYKGETTGNFPDKGHVYYGDGTWKIEQKSFAVQWFIKRIELSKKDVTGGIVERLDAAADTYAEKRNKVNEKHRKKLEDEEKKHRKLMDEIQNEYDKALDKAYKKEKKCVAEAHINFVIDAYVNAKSINKAIEDAVSQKDKDDILKKWRTGVLYPAQAKEYEAKIEAGKMRENEASKAYDRKSEETMVEYERYRDAIEPINKALADELNELSREYYGYYHEKERKHVNGIIDEIYKTRKDKVDAIFDTYDEKLEGASEVWEKNVKDATEKLRLKNPYDDEAGTPIDEVYKKLLDETLPEEGPQREEFNQYLRDEYVYHMEYARADVQYGNDKTDLLKERYEALEQITTEDVNMRTLWTGGVYPMGNDELKDPDTVECVVKSVLHVFVVTEPRTLTGVDFRKYYEEIREKEEKEKRKGDQ